MQTQSLLRGLTLLSLATVAHAETLLVDDDGGPGVDYLDLPAAIAGAQDGDVIFLREGRYTQATIANKRLTLISDPAAWLCADPMSAICALGTLEIHSTTPSKPVVVVGGPRALLDIHDTAGMVLIDRFDHGLTFTCNNVADLRCQDSSFESLGTSSPAMTIGDPQSPTPARLELLRVHAQGRHGSPGFYEDGENGSDAAEAFSTNLHAALSTFAGGWGGNFEGFVGGFGPGDGGDGLTLSSDSSARLVGPNLVLAPGLGGYDFENDEWGADGSALVANGTVVQDSLDPSLEIIGEAQFGQGTLWRCWAPPGSVVDLQLGTRPQALDDGLADVELLVKPLRTYPLGVMPATGFLDFGLPALPQLGIGSIVIGQAFIDLGPGDVRRSNSATAVMITPIP